MQSYIKLFAIIILTSLVSTGFAQQTSDSGSGTAETLSFPYMAEITGDNLYVRSGPGTNYYFCSKLSKGDKVKIVGKQFSWLRIVPPPGSFSWISMQYVNIDPDNTSSGTVTGDRVRVYTGSEYEEPLHSTYLQGKLNRGDKVRLLGEQKDDYYKIAPPSFAYLWVSSKFTKPLPGQTVKKVTPLPAATVKPPVTEVKTTEAKTTETVTTEPAITQPKNQEPIINPREIIKAVIPEPATPEELLERYKALQKQVQDERAKPIDKQDYTEIKKALTAIAENKIENEEAVKAARYAEYVLKQIKDLELVLAVNKQIKLQSEQLVDIRSRIEKNRSDKLSEFKDLSDLAVVGTLRNFETYGPGNYRIVDETGRTICYALPSGVLSPTIVSKYVGKKVGLVGTIEPHQQTKGALVKFHKIVEIEE
ncbi:MAG: hypothetical protein JW837_10605 [Sedimentisphaerales bacterium]|nr:hypothetical protein [Sedimentisphaerales bacterium]